MVNFIYGFTVGIFSSRKFQRACQENLAFKCFPGHRDIYRRRKCTVEPMFGQIQIGMGFTRFFYRGRRNAAREWNWVCAALNIKKMAALMRKAGVSASISAHIGEYIRSLLLWIGRTAFCGAPIPHPA